MNMLKKFKLRILGALVLVPLAIMSGCTGDTNTPATTGTGNDSVQGVVIDTVSGAPLSGVTVKSGWATAVTDKSGVYNLGTAPYTINSGNIAMPDATYVVAIDTTTNTGAAAAGYGSTYFRRVSVGQAASDANILRIGQLNATVKGNVLNSNGTYAALATVTLTYVANGANESTATQNTAQTLTASSLSAVTATDGTYSITKVEAGSQFTLQARNAAGTHTTRSNTYQAAAAAGTTYAATVLPPINNYTYGGNNGNNDTNLTFAAAPDGNQPLTLVSAAITVGAATATSVQSGDFAAGASTITYTFSRAVAASAYTATAGVYQADGAAPLNSLMNDINITGTTKLGNVAYTVAWGTDMKTLTVTFTTSPSMVYTVNILNALNKFKDAAGVAYNNATTATLLNTPTAQIAFSTSGSPAVGTLSATPISRTTGTPAGDTTISIAPVTNMAGYYLYVSRYVNDVLTVNPTAYHTGGAKRVLTVPSVNLNANAAGGGQDFDAGANNLSAFAALGNGGVTGFYNGINKISYKVKVVYLNADRIELPVNTTADFLIDDKTKVPIAYVASAAAFAASTTATDLSIGSYPAVTVNTASSTAAVTNGTQGRAKSTNSGVVNNKFIFPDIRTIDSTTAGGTAGIPATFTGSYYAFDTNDLTTTKQYAFVAKVTFGDQMIASQVTDGTKWGITDTAAVGATVAPLAQVIGLRTNNTSYVSNIASGGCENVSLGEAVANTPGGTAKCYAGVTLVVNSVTYDVNTLVATINYGLNWSFTQPYTVGNPAISEFLAGANPAGTGTVYRINVPDFRFTFAGTDLNGNAVTYGTTAKGF